MDDLLTTKQLQEVLQVDRITIYRMLNDGRLSGFKVGGQWRFSAREIERWLRDRREAIEAIPPPPHTESLPPAAHDALPLSCISAIQGIYAEALRVAGVVTNLEGVPIVPVSNSSAFCDLILSTPEGLSRCAADWRQINHERPLPCHAGLLCTSLPIVLEGESLAIAAACQFATPPLGDDSEWQARIVQLATGLSIDEQLLHAAADSVPVLSEAELSRIPHILRRVSETMTEIGQERLKLVSRLRHIAQVSQV
ncbi:MAG TPA: PocR ligand-binding domain-containing protein [Anaerolineae bacterium]|nr:PocR ligand-binding domain-containing protein [Anaerolineae bacterium]